MLRSYYFVDVALAIYYETDVQIFVGNLMTEKDAGYDVIC